MSRLEFFKSIWNSGWKGKVTLVFGAVVAVSAVVGVIYGVATH